MGYSVDSVEELLSMGISHRNHLNKREIGYAILNTIGLSKDVADPIDVVSNINGINCYFRVSYDNNYYRLLIRNDQDRGIHRRLFMIGEFDRDELTEFDVPVFIPIDYFQNLDKNLYIIDAFGDNEIKKAYYDMDTAIIEGKVYAKHYIVFLYKKDSTGNYDVIEEITQNGISGKNRDDYMEYQWKYFIVLNNEGSLHNLVEEKIGDELLMCCDVAVAKSFSSPNELLEWVKENTDLNEKEGDFKIEGQYLPYNL